METRQPQDSSRQPNDRLLVARHGTAPAQRGRVRRWVRGLLLVVVVLGILASIVYVIEPEYAYLPPLTKVLNPERGNQDQAFDVWGHGITQAEATRLLQTTEGQALLSPQHGAVAITDALLTLGRVSFYRETFGNEVFLSEIMGILDGPLTSWRMAKALWKLGGRGTTNLQLPLEEDVTIGGATFPKGTVLNTGLDVVPGSYLPLGLKVKLQGGRLVVGITCALCHATLDPHTMQVVEGGMNSDFNGGLVLALATNSAAYLGHASVASLDAYTTDPQRTVTRSDGTIARLPDTRALEDAVDAGLLQWPPGTFDATTDLVGNPTKINNTFTLGHHPYAWTGIFAAGPFQGLAAITSHVHAIGSDGLSQAASSAFLMDLDPEVYLGTLLQNAAQRRYRYVPTPGQTPSAFFARVDPTPGAPGVNQIVRLPTFPHTSLISEVGLAGSAPGYRFMEQNNALAAFQNTLIPPPAPLPTTQATVTRGRAVFAQAGCAQCHAEPDLTNHRVIPVSEIGTDPSRAAALKTTEAHYVPPVLYTFDTPVPIPPEARPVAVPTAQLDSQQIQLAFAYGGTPGGYKVPSLIGVYWSAPYLHDGGVAVGPNAQTQCGVPGTLLQGIPPDPVNSLRALIDRALRQQVIAANATAPSLLAMHVQGTGHEFWVDAETGFTPADQETLIQYVFSLRQALALAP